MIDPGSPTFQQYDATDKWYCKWLRSIVECCAVLDFKTAFHNIRRYPCALLFSTPRFVNPDCVLLTLQVFKHCGMSHFDQTFCSVDAVCTEFCRHQNTKFETSEKMNQSNLSPSHVLDLWCMVRDLWRFFSNFKIYTTLLTNFQMWFPYVMIALMVVPFLNHHYWIYECFPHCGIKLLMDKIPSSYISLSLPKTHMGWSTPCTMTSGVLSGFGGLVPEAPCIRVFNTNTLAMQNPYDPKNILARQNPYEHMNTLAMQNPYVHMGIGPSFSNL